MIEGHTVEVTKQRNFKRLILKIRPPEGTITISAPIYATKRDIHHFFMANIDQIHTMKVDVINKYQQRAKHYVTGETHYLWGQAYQLVIQESLGPRDGKFVGNQLILTIKKDDDETRRAKVLDDFYRNVLQAKIDELVEDLQREMDVYAREFRIKKMKTRWGSCNIQKRRIWINLALVKAPVECLESVLVHELVHLLEINHTKRFYALMDHYYPDWQTCNALLSKFDELYH